MTDYCWSRGPRIGDEGTPVCFEPAGHYPVTSHRSHPDAGFGHVRWGSPDMTIPECDRENWWTPDRASAPDPEPAPKRVLRDALMRETGLSINEATSVLEFLATRMELLAELRQGYLHTPIEEICYGSPELELAGEVGRIRSIASVLRDEEYVVEMMVPTHLYPQWENQ